MDSSVIGVNVEGRIDFVVSLTDALKDIEGRSGVVSAFPGYWQEREREGEGGGVGGGGVSVGRESETTLKKAAAVPLVAAAERSQRLLPGFVDTHCHAPQAAFAGAGTNTPLLEWLEKFTFPTEARFRNPSAWADSVFTYAVSSSLSAGSTTVSYFGTQHAAASVQLGRIASEAGQRALIGKVCMDRHSPPDYTEADAASSLAATRDFVAQIRALGDDRILPILTPRFVPSCTFDLMKGLGDLAKEEDLHVQSHVGENPDEIAWVASLHPEAESYSDVYRRAGLLGRRTVLAHGVYLSDAEVAMLRESGTAIAHCPLSNYTLHSGVAKIRRLLREGVAVGLGTDVAGGYDLSMWSAMRHAITTSSVVFMTEGRDHETAAPLGHLEALWLATRGGAASLDLDTDLGCLTPGQLFDAIVVDAAAPGTRIRVDDYDTDETLVEKMVYLADDRNVTHVFVRGQECKGRNAV